MDSFSTLRSILSTTSSPPIPNGIEKSITDRSDIDPDIDQAPKTCNKRKAAFEIWHQKKLAQMITTNSNQQAQNSDATKSLLRQYLLSNGHSKNGQKTSNGMEIEKWEELTTTATARYLTTPKLSRHNDAAFYPNIQCILCHEWVCSRNRYMHIESHFQYRPYKCSVCGYDNRKQIFIELHINRVHKGAAQIQYSPDSELEKRAWTMAEQCLQHTREVLLRRQMKEDDQKSDHRLSDHQSTPSIAPKCVSPASEWTNSTPLMAPYALVYRPKIYNNQRSEKSNLIEESRMLGLIPDFSEVTAREECCRVCESHVLRTPSLLEEHARSHLSRPTYGCSIDTCPVLHHSRNFVMRHMKEVHRVRRGVVDLLERDRELLDEYLLVCARCFPEFFADGTKGESCEKLRQKFNGSSRSESSNAASPQLTTCFGCKENLNLIHTIFDDGKCASCRDTDQGSDHQSKSAFVAVCGVCSELQIAQSRYELLHRLEQHSIKHSSTVPFQCGHCPFANWKHSEINTHFQQQHPSKSMDIRFRWEKIDWRQQWQRIFQECFGHDRNPIQDHLDLDIRIQCIWCEHCVASGFTDDHMKRAHPDRPMIKSYLITTDQKDIRSVLNRIESSKCVKPKKRVEKSQIAQSKPKGVYCQLCHLEISDEPNSHILHLQYHLTAPVYKCRACSYVDVDVDRMKEHVDEKHEGKVAYYAETLPIDQEMKAFQLMQWCFQLNF